MKELYKIQAEKDDGTIIEIEIDIEELSKTMICVSKVNCYRCDIYAQCEYVEVFGYDKWRLCHECNTKFYELVSNFFNEKSKNQADHIEIKNESQSSITISGDASITINPGGYIRFRKEQ